MPGDPALLGTILGASAFHAGHRLYKWADSRYISSKPVDSVSSNMKTRRYQRRPLKRRNRRRRRRGIIRRRIPRAITSRTKLIRAKCVRSFSLTTSTASSAQVISLFDITDPFVGSGAQQPLGYDQWKGLYNKAYVVGTKITVNMHNKGTTAIMFGITPMPESQGSTGLGPLHHYMELPGTVSRLLSPDVDHGICVKKISNARHVHVSKLKDEDAFHVDLDNETGPTRQAYAMFWAGTVDETTSNSCEGVVTVEYLIKLYDPIVPARSVDS